jgi:hypothetical protein
MGQQIKHLCFKSGCFSIADANVETISKFPKHSCEIFFGASVLIQFVDHLIST